MRVSLFCTLLSLLLLASPLVQAQSYIYPVATGVSWGEEHFRRQEAEETQRHAQALPLPGGINF